MNALAIVNLRVSVLVFNVGINYPLVIVPLAVLSYMPALVLAEDAGSKLPRGAFFLSGPLSIAVG